jgi:hypothetical protein
MRCVNAIVLTVTLASCGAAAPTPAASQDASGQPPARDGSADTMSANAVSNDATSVAFSAGSGNPPTFTGGGIRDGVYHATKAEAWGTTSGTGRRFTLVVLEGGTKFYYAGDILDAQGAVATTMVAVTTASTSGNQLTQSTVCMVGSAQIPTIESYTATSDALILSATQGTVVSATTYTRVGCP